MRMAEAVVRTVYRVVSGLEKIPVLGSIPNGWTLKYHTVRGVSYVYSRNLEGKPVEVVANRYIMSGVFDIYIVSIIIPNTVAGFFACVLKTKKVARREVNKTVLDFMKDVERMVGE